jgi:hypothetical protein
MAGPVAQNLGPVPVDLAGLLVRMKSIANVRRNAQFIKAEAVSLGDRIKQTTGIETKEDLKQMVAGSMKLFAECVNQFTAGYRRERDDEVEQMLTQYFQHLETAPPTHRPKKRRKAKPGFAIAHGRSFGNVIYERRFRLPRTCCSCGTTSKNRTHEPLRGDEKAESTAFAFTHTWEDALLVSRNRFPYRLFSLMLTAAI